MRARQPNLKKEKMIKIKKKIKSNFKNIFSRQLKIVYIHNILYIMRGGERRPTCSVCLSESHMPPVRVAFLSVSRR